ncbi:MAG: DUF861 domain-containing protein [Rhodospirillaceae bacterium]|nr:MAG: DUF861 domain-containing protein [Rhodospirillaceae bacterium]
MLEQWDKVAISAINIPLQDVSEEQRVEGTPRTGAVHLVTFEGGTIGVWEMTHGVMRDTEVEEIFTVLAGKASIEFEDGKVIDIAVGDIVRLHAGQRTIWRVTETLRKLYFSFSSPKIALSFPTLPFFV